MTNFSLCCHIRSKVFLKLHKNAICFVKHFYLFQIPAYLSAYDTVDLQRRYYYDSFGDGKFKELVTDSQFVCLYLFNFYFYINSYFYSHINCYWLLIIFDAKVSSGIFIIMH